MTEKEQTISELMKTAGVSSKRHEDARVWLTARLAPTDTIVKSRAKSRFDTVDKKPIPRDFNKPLQRVSRTATRLKEALSALRVHPYSHHAFWCFDGSDELPPFGSDSERNFLEMVDSIVAAAEAATRSGRSESHGKMGKQRIVDEAYVFLNKFRPGLRRTNKQAQDFAERFYQEVVGTKETLGKQIRRVGRKSGK